MADQSTDCPDLVIEWGDYLYECDTTLENLQGTLFTSEEKPGEPFGVGRLVVDKSGGDRVFRDVQGYFLKRYEPKETERYVPAFRRGRGAAEPPRVTVDQEPNRSP